jgi:hypothetical protein
VARTVIPIILSPLWPPGHVTAPELGKSSLFYDSRTA